MLLLCFHINPAEHPVSAPLSVRRVCRPPNRRQTKAGERSSGGANKASTWQQAWRHGGRAQRQGRGGEQEHARTREANHGGKHPSWSHTSACLQQHRQLRIRCPRNAVKGMQERQRRGLRAHKHREGHSTTAISFLQRVYFSARQARTSLYPDRQRPHRLVRSSRGYARDSKAPAHSSESMASASSSPPFTCFTGHQVLHLTGWGSGALQKRGVSARWDMFESPWTLRP